MRSFLKWPFISDFFIIIIHFSLTRLFYGSNGNKLIADVKGISQHGNYDQNNRLVYFTVNCDVLVYFKTALQYKQYRNDHNARKRTYYFSLFFNLAEHSSGY